jgi:aminopeptidase YwaD
MILPEAKFPTDEIEGKKGKLLIFGEIERGNLFNVSLIIPGSKNEFILIYANHDTAENTQGASESAAGVAALLEIAKKISRHKLNYTYRFITLGGTEIGLEGMKRIIEDYDASKVILGISIDSIVSKQEKIVPSVSGDKHLKELVETVNDSFDFPVEIKKGTPLNNDSLVLNEKDIPSITISLKDDNIFNFARTEFDSINEYVPDSMKIVGDYILKLVGEIEQLEDAKSIRSLPKELKDEAEKYFEILRLYQE